MNVNEADECKGQFILWVVSFLEQVGQGGTPAGM